MSVSNALRVKMIQEESENVAGIKDYLHLIVNSIAQGIIVISSDDNISLFNRTAELMVGVEEQNASGINYQKCLPAKLSAVIKSLLCCFSSRHHQHSYHRPQQRVWFRSLLSA